MKKGKLLGVFAMTAALMACSDEKTLSIEVPANTAPEAKNLIHGAWPKVLSACPGLNRYAIDLSFAGLEDNLSFAPENAKRIDIKFRVADAPTRIPTSYRAFGHMCYFSVTPDGKKLIISKSSCASICIDTEISDSNFEKLLR